MQITFLIGNGFDVNLGLETRYKDFYPTYIESNKNLSGDSYIKKFCSQIEDDYDNWSDFELAFSKKARGTHQEIGEIIADFNDKFADYLKMQCEKCDYGLAKQSENEMKTFVIEPYKFLERGDEQILKAFYQACQREIHTYNFISFNYTDTLDKLLAPDARKSFPARTLGYENVYNPILHLHGSIEEGYIIIGVDSLDQFESDEMKKNMRLGRHCVKSIINNQNGYRNKEEKFVQLIQSSNVICVYGMAFGETDRKRWNVVGEWLRKRKENKLVIFKYNPGFEKLNRMSKGLLLDAIEEAKDTYLNILGFENELEKMYEQIFVADSSKALRFKLIENQKQEKGNFGISNELIYNSPIGYLTITAQANYITGLYLNTETIQAESESNNNPLSPLLIEARNQLDEYFSGSRTTFDLPIKYPSGTPFQHSVWNALRDIPYGKTRSYEDIALAIDNPKAVRAIGQANTRNPILLLVPCHRVINKNGTIGGFGCGVEIKQKLLELEGVNIK